MKLLLSFGIKNLIAVDREGAICKGYTNNEFHAQLAGITNPYSERGSLADVLRGADLFIGVSVAGILTSDMVATMNKDAIVFAMANPNPEIMPPEAHRAGALIVGTGRSDYPNQVNNVLAFPGIFRGALDVRASEINEEMKVAAAHAIAGIIADPELAFDRIIPQPFDERVAPKVAAAVAEAAIKSGVARNADIMPEMVEMHTKEVVAKFKATSPQIY
jgi:malate dehydrogenase (oxaloacetate-decarboxylating)